jgi:hypothetical protein
MPKNGKERKQEGKESTYQRKKGRRYGSSRGKSPESSTLKAAEPPASTKKESTKKKKPFLKERENDEINGQLWH